MNEHIDFAKELAHEAGEIMMKYFQAENLGLELKEDKSPVTLADTEVNALVIARVKQRFPDHGVLGEEDSFNLKSNKLWIVDPVDGTSSFARGLAGWVFSMAYVEDGKPQVAVVYDPILRRLFWAAEGKGAYENERRLELKDSTPEGILEIFSWVSGGLKILVFKDPTTEGKIIEAYNRHGGIFNHDGPVAHYLSLCAAGRLDAAVSSCMTPWDLAAGGFIAQQAGAKVTDIFGDPIERWDQNILGILAAPPKIHAMILEIITPITNNAART
jgi:fructose-1,6-bisphosphatase/inositol monophosphatase family enzyme